MIDDFNLIKEWYILPSVKFEMIKYTYKREFSLLVPSFKDDERFKNIRMLKCHSVQHLDYNLNYVGMFHYHRLYNFYYSLAKYREGIPNQTLKFGEKRDKTINNNWKDEHYKYMIGYDFLLDIDSNNHKNMKYAKETIQEIIKLFNKFNTPFSVRFSGMGFHLIIPSRYFNGYYKSFNPNKINSIYKVYIKIAEYFNKNYSEMIDTTIYDSRRICKIPYSLSLYEDNVLVCSPINSIKELQFFNFKDYEPDTICYQVQNRGEHLFNSKGSLTKLKEVVKW